MLKLQYMCVSGTTITACWNNNLKKNTLKTFQLSSWGIYETNAIKCICWQGCCVDHKTYEQMTSIENADCPFWYKFIFICFVLSVGLLYPSSLFTKIISFTRIHFWLGSKKYNLWFRWKCASSSRVLLY